MAKKTASKSTKKSARAGARSAKSAKGARKTGARKTGARKTAARKTAARKGGARKAAGRKSAGRKTSARRPNAAFMAPVTPSESLAPVVGAQPIPRTEVTKRLWAYIKKNKLQDPKNPRNIRADAALKPVFGGKGTVNMFEMTKLVNQHLG
jgi:upstream activation factor subunit UAF30